jgi:hypothetical protein
VGRCCRHSQKCRRYAAHAVRNHPSGGVTGAAPPGAREWWVTERTTQRSICSDMAVPPASISRRSFFAGQRLEIAQLFARATWTFRDECSTGRHRTRVRARERTRGTGRRCRGEGGKVHDGSPRTLSSARLGGTPLPCLGPESEPLYSRAHAALLHCLQDGHSELHRKRLGQPFLNIFEHRSVPMCEAALDTEPTSPALSGHVHGTDVRQWQLGALRATGAEP